VDNFTAITSSVRSGTGVKAATPLLRGVQWWIRQDEALVRVSALCFLQCSNSVGTVTDTTSGLYNHVVSLFVLTFGQ